MSFSSNSNPGMGRTNREKNLRDGAKSEPSVDSNDDEGPIDLSMPRFPNRKKESRGSNSYFAAGRRKPASSYDVDASEQPINYSKKYVESNTPSAVKTNYVPRNSLNKVKIDHREREKRFSQQDEKAYPYGDYAETDLDQPTDYSLRYAEDDTDDEEKQNNAYFNGNEQEDTVKTYCTEGTPYETPFNVSSATSMSDLRVEDGKDGEGPRRTARRIIQDSRNARDATMKQPIAVCKEQEDKEEKEDENEILTKESKNISNELVLNSSSASIEKPINYNDEGTPGRISRVSSLSSLGCTNGPRNEDVEETTEPIEVQTTPAFPVSPITSVDECRAEIEDAESSLVVVAGTINDEETAISGPEEEKGHARVVDKEGKVVTFGGEDHYAEQTPLMFSRSSSLGSLSGFEQHSIHDDRSSIISDFSRRTSGVVSPSEFPDSPTQTVPPSPRHNQQNNTNDFSPRAPPLRHFSYVKSPRSKSSVFEDNVTAFKEESTPIEFSAATSLSSLTIDDEPKIIMDAKEKDYPKKARTVGRFLVITSDEERNVEAEKNENESVETRDSETDRGNREQVSDGDEDDEDILAACISVGMRNSMYRQSCKNISEIPEKDVDRSTLGDSATNLVRYQTSSTLDRLVADVAAVSISPSSKMKNSIDAVAVPHDSVRIYCTEDTPANISPVGSQSNLSALSALSISGEIEKDDGNHLSEEYDDDKILDDCIRAGIARTLQGANSFPNTAAVTELNSPSHASSTMKCLDDDKILDDCIRSGIARTLQGSNSFPGTAAATTHNSPLHASSTKKLEAYFPKHVDTRRAFSTSKPSPDKSNDVPTRRTSSVISNSTVVDHDTSGDDDKILDDCIRAGIARTLQGSNSFPGTAAATNHNSPLHASSTKKLEAYLPKHVDTRQAFSTSKPSPDKSNDASTRRTSSAISNSTSGDHDTSGDDDKILDDCIRAGIARTLQGDISFPSTAAVTKHNSPHHAASTKKSKVYLPRPVDNRQASSLSKPSPAKGYDAPIRLASSAISNSTAVDHDTSGDDDKILDDCIRAGIARTLRGSNSFPGTAAATKHNSPLHAPSTKKLEEYFPKHVETRPAFSTSKLSPDKSNDASTRRTSSAISNSTAVDHDTSGDDDKILDDCIRAGIARTLQGDVSFPSTAAVTKHHSPRHAASTKKSKVYLSRPVDNRQASSLSKPSPAKSNDAPIRLAASTRSNYTAVDHDTSGDDDKILDDCIRAGIARTLQGSNSFPGTAAATKHNSPLHAPSTKKLEAYFPKHVDTRRVFSTSKLSPDKSNDAPTRRTSSAISNSTAVDHDTSGDDDKILDDCIRAGIARTLQGDISFPSTAAVTKHHSPRHAASTKKTKVYLPRPVDNRQASSLSKPSPVKSNDPSIRRAASARSNYYVVDYDTTGSNDKTTDDYTRPAIARTLHGGNSFPGTAAATKFNSPRHASSTKKYHDDDKILDDCTRSGIARTLQGSNSFPGTASATKHNSPHHASTTKKLEAYFPKLVDGLQAFSISSPSSAKINDPPDRHTSSARSNSIAADHDTSGEDDKILDECIKVGIARTLQGVISFPSTASVTKNISPRHAVSTKKSKLYVPRPVDNRQAYSLSKPLPGKNNETPVRRTSSARSNFTAVDHDTSGDDDKILDDCIRSGIGRTLHGANSCPSTAASTKHNSPRHTSSTKISEVYLPRPVDTRQAFSSTKSSPARSNEPPTRRASSARSNFTCVDHDTSGDDDNILDDCIRAGIARTLQGGAIPFSSTVAVTKLHSPRHASLSKKSDVYLPRPVETRQTLSMSSTALAQCNDVPARGTTSARSNSTAVDHDTSGDDDKILDDCIRAGIARTLQGANTFTSTAAVTKSNSPRHASSTKKSELYLPRPVDNRQAFSMYSTSPAKSNDTPIRRTSSPRSTVIDHYRIPYDDSPNHTDEETILTQCIQSAMSKGKSQAKSQSSRKIPKRPARNSNPNETSSCSSTRVTTEVFRTSVTRILMPVTNRDDETFGDNSSLSEDEECIRSGMARASSMPPKHTNYQRDDRRTREQ